MFRLPRCSSSGGLTSFQCLQKSLIKPQIEGDEFKLEADWVIFWELLPSVIGVKTWFEEKKIWTWRARRSSLAFSSGVAQTSFLGFEMTHSLSLWTTWASSKYQSIQCHSSRTLLWYVVAPPEPRARSRPRIFRDIVLSHSDESPLRCPQWPPSRARSVSSTTHCMSRRGCLRIWPSAGRRKKTGSRRRIALTEHLVAEDPNSRLGELQYWAPASRLPSPLLSCLHCLSHFPLTSHTDGHGWWLVLVDPLILQPRASRPYHISWSWTEDWQQKKDRYQRRPGRGRPPEAGELLSRALPPVSPSGEECLLSPTEANFTRSFSLQDTKTGVRGGPSRSPHCRARLSTTRGESNPLCWQINDKYLQVFLLRFELRWETSSQSQSRVPSPKEVCRRIVSLRLPGGFPPGSPVSTQHQNYWISKFSKISFHFN